MIWHSFSTLRHTRGQDMFLEKFHNKCVRIQYFVGNERVEAVGHLSAEDANFICLKERSQLIKISSITSVFEEPELTAEPEISPILSRRLSSSIRYRALPGVCQPPPDR